MEMKRFCSIPFNRVALKVSGKVFLCCKAWLDLPIGNIFKSPFSEIWNSQTAKNIRKSIFDGSFKFCDKSKCPRIVSGLVEKEVNNKEFLDIIKEKKISLDRGPQLISLNYDNSCNLHCKSCRNKVKVLNKEKQEKIIRFQDSLIKSELFKNAARLVVTGSGDPFASAVYMDLFTKKIQKSEHPGLKITLRTNGILLTPGNWKRIKNVHYAIDKISISIDAATEKTYQVLRRGGNFNKLLNNLGFLKKLKKKNNIKVELNFVVQKSNYREMPGFVKLAKKFDCDEVAFTKIINRGTYNSEDYNGAAVHETDNPEFLELKKILMSPILEDPIVDLRNLSNLKN